MVDFSQNISSSLQTTTLIEDIRKIVFKIVIMKRSIDASAKKSEDLDDGSFNIMTR